MAGSEGKVKGLGRLRFRRLRSRSRAIFILVGFLVQWSTPYTLAAGGGVLILARALQMWAYGHLDKASRTSTYHPTKVTSSGPYAHVRNPIMYGSAFSDLGFLVMTGNPILLAAYAVVMVPVHIRRVLHVEEPFLRRRYGESYETYAAAVPRFLPRLLPAPERDRKPFRFRLVLGNRELSRTFNYLFLGSALVIWSDVGASGYIPSWDGLKHGASQPWALALTALLGALALLASFLQRGVDRAKSA